MRVHTAGCRRSAVTLVELLVVISIVLVLASLAILLMPGFAKRQKTAQGGGQVQGVLQIAKQQALRDRTLYGVRLIPDPKNPQYVRELQYISQPPDFTVGKIASGTNSGTTGVVTFDFSAAPGLDLRMIVSPNDFLVIRSTETYRIASVDSATQVTLASALASTGTTPNPYASADYRIILGPKPVPSEENIQLPEGVVIDLGTATSPLSTPNPMIDILFRPTGGLVQTGASLPGKIVLWVRDTDFPKPTEGDPVLIVIYAHGGLIASHEVAPGTDPYAFTRDPRPSRQ